MLLFRRRSCTLYSRFQLKHVPTDGKPKRERGAEKGKPLIRLALFRLNGLQRACSSRQIGRVYTPGFRFSIGGRLFDSRSPHYQPMGRFGARTMYGVSSAYLLTNWSREPFELPD